MWLSGVVLNDGDIQLGSGAEVQGDRGAAQQDGEYELSGMKLSSAEISPSGYNYLIALGSRGEECG